MSNGNDWALEQLRQRQLNHLNQQHCFAPLDTEAGLLPALSEPQPPKRSYLYVGDPVGASARRATPADLDRLGYRQDKHHWHGKYATEILRELYIAGVIAQSDTAMHARLPELQKKIQAWLTDDSAWATNEADE